MLYLKQCPRCKGDVYRTKDSFGEYLACLQCGYSRDIDSGPLASMVTAAQAKPEQITVGAGMPARIASILRSI